MTLDRRVLNLQIQGGVNERVDPRVAVSPIVLKNCRYTKTGTLTKRTGSQCIAQYAARYNSSVAPTSAPPTPQLLTTRQDELVQVGSGELDTVTTAFTAASKDHVYRGNVPSCALRKSTRVGDAFRPGDTCAATVTSGTYAGRLLIMTAYPVRTSNASATTLYLDIEDYATGTLVLSGLSVVSGTTVSTTVRVVQANDIVAVVYAEGTNLKFRTLDLTAASLSLDSATTVTTCVSGTQFIDAAMTPGGPSPGPGLPTWMIYTITVGNAGADYKVSYADSGGTLSTNAVTLNTIVGVALRCDYLDTYYYVAVADANAGTTTAYGRRFTPGGSTAAAVAFSLKAYTSAATALEMAIGRQSDSLHTFAWSDRDTRTFYWDKRNNSDAAQFSGTTRQIGAGSTLATHPQHTLAVRPFLVGTKMYAGILSPQFSESSAYNLGTMHLVDLYVEDNSATVNTGRIEASCFVQQCFLTDANSSAIAVPKELSLGSSVYGFNVATTDATASVVKTCVIQRALADFANVPQQPAIANGAATLGGGVPVSYDGAVAVETGIAQTPLLGTPSASAVGSALTLLGTYSYCAMFEWFDALGNVHRSPVSATKTATLTGSNDALTLTLSNLHLTNRKAMVSGVVVGPVWIVLYRTLANGSTYYRQGKYVSAVNGADVSVTDTTTDATLQFQPLLPTTGNVLESHAPPSAAYQFRALDRIWLVDTDDGTVWFSDTIVQGEAPRFNIAFTVPPPKEGKYVAGCQLDNNVVLFTRDSIDMLFGDGPDSTGIGSFSQRYRIASDVGCNEPRSVSGPTPYGTFFQSRYGLCRLDRSQGVHRIGIAVEDTTAANTSSPYSIVAAVNDSTRSEVWFPLDIASVQRAVVYDIVESANLQDTDAIRPVWYVDDYTDAVGGTPKIVSGCYWNGKRTWVNSAGRVYQELSSTYLDTASGYTSAWVTMTVQTSHWNSQGLGSWMSVFGAGALLEYLTDHNVTISVYQDWAASSPQAGTWTHTEVTSARSATREQLMVALTTQKAQAVSVKITDATPTAGTVGTGQGFRVTGVPLELCPRDGMICLPQAARK